MTSHPHIWIDSCAFNVSAFRHWLARYPGKKSMSVVAYAEIGVGLVTSGKPIDDLDELIRGLKIKLDWVKPDAARRAMVYAGRSGEFKENGRDHLIAGHLNGGDQILVTDDDDFKAFLEIKYLKTVDEAMSDIEVY